MASEFRLTMDEPITEVTEPGALRTFHSYEFVPDASSTTYCWQEPVTGAIMLRPSFLTPDWYNESNWKPISDWLVSASWWEQVYRGNTGAAGETARFFGNILSSSPTTPYGVTSGSPPSVIGVSVAAGVALFKASLQDTLVYSAQSLFTLARDEGFVFHLRFEADELHRYRNLLYLQWGQIGFHLASDGTLSAFHYKDGSTNPPILLDSHDIGDLGRIHNRDFYLVFLPIPGHGMVVHAATGTEKLGMIYSAANLSASKGHLFRFPVLYDGANSYVHNGGKINLYTLPVDTQPSGAKVRYKLGYHAIRYPTGVSRTFTGPVFDWGYIPTDGTILVPGSPPNTPEVGAIKTPDGRGTATATLRKGDNSGVWIPNQNDSRRARIQIALETDDARYTPYVIGAQARLQRRTLLRGTTTKTLKWEKLEFAIDEYGRIDGLAECVADTQAAFTMFRRADAPWRLEWTADAGVESPTWITIGGGWAKLMPNAEYYTVGKDANVRGRIKGTWQLFGKDARLRELHVFLEAAFDGETFTDAINNVLLAAGQDPIPDLEFPSYLTTLRLPPMQAQQNYRFGVNPGDSGDDVLNRLLFLARGQYREFRLRYDWAAQRYRIEQKQRDASNANSYLFTPFENEVGVDFGGIPAANTRLIGFPDQNLTVFPPEASLVQAVGVTEPGKGGKQVVGYPFRSLEVQTNASSLNYLGRMVGARPLFEELSDTREADIMSRRLFDIISVREEMLNVVRVGFDVGLLPCGFGTTVFGPPRSLVRAMDAAGTRITMIDGWLKRVHVAAIAGFCGSEEVTYTVSSRWEGGLHD